MIAEATVTGAAAVGLAVTGASAATEAVAAPRAHRSRKRSMVDLLSPPPRSGQPHLASPCRPDREVETDPDAWNVLLARGEGPDAGDPIEPSRIAE
ncbi:hypothetical protein GCM10022263_17070 [Nocardioides daeguensis]|uniref:Secreted protein n=1 Tax=Nocardioides daeguensis TaxID=908359 RepID=A0ABP6V5B1_9ACTN